jgi:hypothetical protein
MHVITHENMMLGRIFVRASVSRNWVGGEPSPGLVNREFAVDGGKSALWTVGTLAHLTTGCRCALIDHMRLSCL